MREERGWERKELQAKLMWWERGKRERGNYMTSTLISIDIRTDRECTLHSKESKTQLRYTTYRSLPYGAGKSLGEETI